jgi:hypothetical protein
MLKGRSRTLLVIVLVLCVVSVAGFVIHAKLSQAAGPEIGPPRPGPSAAAPVVIATVNGEPIYESDITASLPADSFDMVRSQAGDTILRRLINVRIVEQFLSSQQIQVSEEKINAAVKDMEKNPPAAGCPCCRYDSLDAFLKANFMSRKELRDMIAINLGTDQYLDTLWEKEYPAGEKRNALVEKERPRVCKNHIKVSHILFRTTQGTGITFDAAKVKEAKANAQSAWERLQKGAKFDEVAGDSSQDSMTNKSGGELGLIPIDTFGRPFAMAVAALAPGDYSKPVQSPWGIHIIRRETPSDEDVAGVIAQEFKDAKFAETQKAVTGTAVVNIMGQQSSAVA